MVNPIAQSYLYKITATDSNNIETDINLSKLNKTIHLITTKGESGGIQLEWDDYIGFPYKSYYIYRGSSKNNFKLVHTVASTIHAWTDDTVVGPNVILYYFVAVQKANPCYPGAVTTLKASGDIYSQSFSNMEDNKLKVTVPTEISGIISTHNSLNIYPNPSTDFTTVSYQLQIISDVNIVITDLMGNEMVSIINAKQQPAGEYKVQINTNEFNSNSGVYLLKLKAGNVIITKKLVVVR